MSSIDLSRVCRILWRFFIYYVYWRDTPMDMIFNLGKANDIDELELLYNDLNDHLA